MENIRNYQRCHVMGEGRLKTGPSEKEYDFQVIDISASGVRILTAADMQEGTNAHMKIVFGSHIVDVPLDVSGTVEKKEKRGRDLEYALRFVSLSHKDRVEIDEIITRTCGLGGMG